MLSVAPRAALSCFQDCGRGLTRVTLVVMPLSFQEKRDSKYVSIVNSVCFSDGKIRGLRCFMPFGKTKQEADSGNKTRAKRERWREIDCLLELGQRLECAFTVFKAPYS